MNGNLDYLFWSHTIFWILIFGYTLNLILKNKRLSREIELLKGGTTGAKKERQGESSSGAGIGG